MRNESLWQMFNFYLEIQSCKNNYLNLEYFQMGSRVCPGQIEITEIELGNI